MREPMQVPPLSQLLRTAAGLGVDVQPDALPASAEFLYQTIYDSLIPDLYLKHEQRHRVALDTAIVLCATHDSERLVPTNVECVGRTLGECFAAYGLPVERRVRHTLRVLADAHAALDAAVAAAYGWDADISEEQALEELLGMNQKAQPQD